MKREAIQRYALPTLSASAARQQTGLTVELDEVYKKFNAESVLKGVDLRVEAGEFIAVVGRSGCGKSTLLRLMAGLDNTSGGRIRLSESGSAASAQGAVRMMFQDSRLLPWKTVLQNVGLGLAGDWQPSAYRALHQVGLVRRAQDWPAVLSGGQRQRVALARALVHQPKLLLLDEPLGALDALTRIEMQQLIEDIWRTNGFTAVLVTHDVAEAVALADRVLLVEDGRITLDLRVDLPRPRHRGAGEFAEIEEAILRHILNKPLASSSKDASGRARVRAVNALAV